METSKVKRKRVVDATRATLSPEDLAAFLNCGRTTAYALLKRGDLRSFRIGGLRRVRREDALAYRNRLLEEADGDKESRT